MKEIGQIMGYTESRISQLHTQAMFRLIPSCNLTSNIKIWKICHRAKFFRVFSEIIQSLTKGVLYPIKIPEGSISKILLP